MSFDSVLSVKESCSTGTNRPRNGKEGMLRVVLTAHAPMKN